LLSRNPGAKFFGLRHVFYIYHHLNHSYDFQPNRSIELSCTCVCARRWIREKVCRDESCFIEKDFQSSPSFSVGSDRTVPRLQYPANRVGQTHKFSLEEDNHSLMQWSTFVILCQLNVTITGFLTSVSSISLWLHSKKVKFKTKDQWL
jgi:hypothetical protein